MTHIPRKYSTLTKHCNLWIKNHHCIECKYYIFCCYTEDKIPNSCGNHFTETEFKKSKLIIKIEGIKL